MLAGPGCGFLGDLLGTSEKPRVAPSARPKAQQARPVVAASAVQAGGPAAQEPISSDEVIKAEDYRYIAADKRDPFRPFIILAKLQGELLLPPLQRYDVAQLRVVGIVIMDNNKSGAMVEDASGKGYVVTRGSRIGRRNGVVVRIEDDRVIVEEQYKDSAGNMKSKEVSMKLYRVEGEGS
jgi:Tfp pilus assembly protein PilP